MTSSPVPSVLLAHLDAVVVDARKVSFPFDKSLVLLYDIKDAESFTLHDDFDYFYASEVVACYRSMLEQYWKEYFGDHPDQENLDAESFLEDFFEDLANYVLIRYKLPCDGFDFEKSYALALDRCFFHPHGLWISGVFFDANAMPEIIIDGVAVRTNHNGISIYLPAGE